MVAFLLLFSFVSPIPSAVIAGLAAGFILLGFTIWSSRRASREYYSGLQRMFNSVQWATLDQKGYVATRPAHLLPKGIVDPEQYSKLVYFLVTKRNDDYIRLAYLEALVHEPRRNKGFPYTILFTTLSKSLPGWVRLWPIGRSFESFTQEDLESTEFNKQTHLVAEPKDLAVKLLTPDFMAWYLDRTDPPLIHVEGDTCCLMIEGRISEPRLTALFETLTVAKRFIGRSGALA